MPLLRSEVIRSVDATSIDDELIRSVVFWMFSFHVEAGTGRAGSITLDQLKDLVLLAQLSDLKLEGCAS